MNLAAVPGVAGGLNIIKCDKFRLFWLLYLA